MKEKQVAKSKDLQLSPVSAAFSHSERHSTAPSYYRTVATSPPDFFFEKFKDPNFEVTSAFRRYQQQVISPCLSARKGELIRKHRGNYRKYSVAEKQEAVRQILDGVDAKQISDKYGIPRRNLLRWKKNGCERKEGGGRPTDAQMEFTLYGKIQRRVLTTEKEIRAQAKLLSKLQDFKASKGWYCKFSRRYNQWKRQKQLERGQEQREALLPEPSQDDSEEHSSESHSQAQQPSPLQ